MPNDERAHSKQNRIIEIEDYKGASVSLYTPERDHILEHHDVPMGENFHAIYDSVQSPDSVYESGTHDNREVYFKKWASATYGTKFYTKTIVEYDTDRTVGNIVTAMPSKREGGNVGVRLYPDEEL